MAHGFPTVEGLASAANTLVDVQEDLSDMRKEARGGCQDNLRQELFAARFDQHIARQDAYARQHEEMMERLCSKLDRMAEMLSTIHEIVTRESEWSETPPPPTS